VPVTNDRAVDWSPTWSPDGNYLYFSSDRGGSMNIWRVAIDEATGETLGDPEALTSGGQGDQGFLSVSSDGKRILYNERIFRTFAFRASFDAETATVADDGEPLTRGPILLSRLSLSPDGERIAYIELGGQQDLWAMNVDGTAEEKVTDDVFKDWNPSWLGDNETLYFYSDRGGSYDVWRIRADGSGVSNVVSVPYRVTSAVPSPDGHFVAFHGGATDFTALAEFGEDGGDAEITVLPQVPDDGRRLIPSRWSPDGKWLAGNRAGVLLYSPETGEYRRLTDEGSVPRFTADGSAIVYAVNPPGVGAEWWLLDLQTLEKQQITLPSVAMSGLWLLPDGEHALYVFGPGPEADIWLLEIEEGR
jgi:Tol biopolymer transport system component